MYCYINTVFFTVQVITPKVNDEVSWPLVYHGKIKLLKVVGVPHPGSTNAK